MGRVRTLIHQRKEYARGQEPAGSFQRERKH